MCSTPMNRIFHWGPLTAFGIIKIITLMTIHCSRQWWSPQESISGAANFLLFFSLSGSTIYHFITAIYEGPGYLPLKWKPEKLEDTQYLQFCRICEGYKAPRSHHCRKCGRCILKMDHHCPWINNCVGHRNHGHFTAFLASAVGGCCVSTVILVCWLLTILSRRNINFPPPSVFTLVIVVFTIGLSIGVVLAVGMLLYFQLSAIIRNTTGIEDWIIEKAKYRRLGTKDQFIHPYSIKWNVNIRQVLKWHCEPDGDGIIWPVREGCDQYTLTREQGYQKQEKRRRARRYRTIFKVSGSWIPITYGWRVICHPPCTDEPRIRLEPEDIVTVTRWRRHWLFGEKMQERDDPKMRVKGWFPRISAIEVVENEDYTDSFSKDD
ncbi:palmitoyltransferase ZDHHC6 [Fopius arisanus]|uniref:Palmitoyltransferase n=2 Tax=Fopius arisanus TaxID=64838 RepID=A0A0C9PRD8_9HYME|nr:PREDICTED: palmitoyltransferase ZDHHC6 [Fopius arisanus]